MIVEENLIDSPSSLQETISVKQPIITVSKNLILLFYWFILVTCFISGSMIGCRRHLPFLLLSILPLNLVDVNALDSSGRTALHNAILGRQAKIVEVLLETGADTSLLDRSQDAPLHTAVRTGNANLVQVRCGFSRSSWARELASYCI